MILLQNLSAVSDVCYRWYVGGYKKSNETVKCDLLQQLVYYKHTDDTGKYISRITTRSLRHIHLKMVRTYTARVHSFSILSFLKLLSDGTCHLPL